MQSVCAGTVISYSYTYSVGRARVAAEDAVEKIDRGNGHPVRPRRDGFFVRRLTTIVVAVAEEVRGEGGDERERPAAASAVSEL